MSKIRQTIILILGMMAVLAGVFLGLTAPAVKMLSKCVSGYNLTMENNIMFLRQENWNKSQKCENAREAVLNLKLCYDAVDSRTFVPLEVIFTVARVVRSSTIGGDADRVIEVHNAACEEYPDSLVN